jgi:hypothetical protein
MTADMSGNESTRARPAFGPRMKAAFDMASASAPSCERIVTLSANREATTVAYPDSFIDPADLTRAGIQ